MAPEQQRPTKLKCLDRIPDILINLPQSSGTISPALSPSRHFIINIIMKQWFKIGKKKFTICLKVFTLAISHPTQHLRQLGTEAITLNSPDGTPLNLNSLHFPQNTIYIKLSGINLSNSTTYVNPTFRLLLAFG